MLSLQALCEATGKNEASIKKAYEASGDLGVVAVGEQGRMRVVLLVADVGLTGYGTADRPRGVCTVMNDGVPGLGRCLMSVDLASCPQAHVARRRPCSPHRL